MNNETENRVRSVENEVEHVMFLIDNFDTKDPEIRKKIENQIKGVAALAVMYSRLEMHESLDKFFAGIRNNKTV